MSQIGNFPFLRITIPFAVGAALYDKLDYQLIPGHIWIIALAIFLLFSFMVIKLIPLPSYRMRWLTGTLVIVILIFAGYAVWSLSDPVNQNGGQIKELASSGDKLALIGILEHAPERKTNSWASTMRLVAYHNRDSSIHQVAEKIMVYFAKDQKSLGSLNPGDTLCLFARVNSFRKSGNPEAFDYARFMRRKGITMSVYLDSLNWIRTGSGKQGMASLIGEARKSIYTTVNSSALNEENKGLALAILIGVKNELDEDVNRSFATAGAIHVLCVSGLHVGIIFMMVNMLFGYLQRFRRWGKPLFLLLGLTAIWSYAMITGLPPSVNRASVMFSFMLAGKIMKRKNNSMNSVAASAFILLLNEPSLIFNIGFQLSYLAVTGIITLFPELSKIWVPENRVLLKVRDLALVSICAQLFTFPVAVSVFNIFPNYFLLTNLLVIPITGFVIYSGVFFLVVRVMPVHAWLEKLFDLMLSLMRWLVGLVDKLPGSSTDGISLPSMQMWLLLLAIFALLLWMKGEGKKLLIYAIISLLVCTSMNTIRSVKQRAQNSITIYDVKRVGMADLIVGRSRLTIVTHDSVPERDVLFSAKSLRINAGVYNAKSDFSEVVIKDRSLTLAEHPLGSVLFVNTMPNDTSKVECRIAVIGSRLFPDSLLFEKIIAEIWVVDGSVGAYRAGQWQQIAESMDRRFWNVSEQGALQISSK